MLGFVNADTFHIQEGDVGGIGYGFVFMSGRNAFTKGRGGKRTLLML